MPFDTDRKVHKWPSDLHGMWFSFLRGSIAYKRGTDIAWMHDRTGDWCLTIGELLTHPIPQEIPSALCTARIRGAAVARPSRWLRRGGSRPVCDKYC